MDISVLGPLRLDDGDIDVTPSAPKQRQLLALLLLNANSTVSVDECIRELWDGNSPTGALATVHAHMTQLRKVLAPAASGAGRLMTQGRGYLFAAERGEIDVTVFADRMRAAEVARSAHHLGASARLVGAALELWPAVMLVDVLSGPVSSVLRDGLARRRMDALCLRIDLDLELSRHHELLGELGALGYRHPADERLQVRLMTALYRCGRQVDALAVYRRLCAVLRAEHGVVPSASASRVQTAILSADPRLDGPIAGTGMSLDLMTCV